jgi:ribosomal protein L11 methyltransferase
MASTTKTEHPVAADSPSPLPDDWIQADVQTLLDAGELLAILDDPAVTGAWQEADCIHLYWPGDRWGPDIWHCLRRALTQLGHSDPDRAITINHLANQDWNVQWSRLVEPMRIGRVVIRASWKEVVLSAGDIELILDPKQAFGTGHHATTQLLIEWVQEIVTSSDRVLDVGTGSGILAMVALRLGAAKAMGLDFDPVAIDCARDYAQVNGFDDRLILSVGNACVEQHHDSFAPTLVLANLDRQTLLDSGEMLCRCAAGGARLLLSGLLIEQREEIEAAYASYGVYVKAVRARDGWIALEVAGMESCEGGLCS